MQQAVLLRLAMIEATAAGATNSTHPPTLTSTRFILVALLNRPEEKPFISMVFADERLILQACSRECLLRTLRAWNPRGYSANAFSRLAPGSAFSRRAPSNGLEIHFISNKHCESHFSSAKTTQKKSCFLRAITAVPIR